MEMDDVFLAGISEEEKLVIEYERACFDVASGVGGLERCRRYGKLRRIIVEKMQSGAKKDLGNNEMVLRINAEGIMITNHHQKLVERASEAIKEVFGDTTVSPEVTVNSLGLLRGEIEDLLDCIKSNEG